MPKKYTLVKKVELCRSCRAPVVWAYDYSGVKANKPIILEADPITSHPATGTVFVEDAEGSELVARGAATLDGMFSPFAVYVSHFAYCPDAESWRTKKR